MAREAWQQASASATSATGSAMSALADYSEKSRISGDEPRPSYGQRLPYHSSYHAALLRRHAPCHARKRRRQSPPSMSRRNASRWQEGGFGAPSYPRRPARAARKVNARRHGRAAITYNPRIDMSNGWPRLATHQRDALARASRAAIDIKL